MLNSHPDPFANNEQIPRTPYVQQHQHHQTMSMSGAVRAVANSVGAGPADRGAILAGAVVSPLGPQRIIAQI